MSERPSPTSTLLRIRWSRNQLLVSQVAVLELARLSETEAARLDFPESRAARLKEALGRPEMDIESSLTLWEATEEFFKVSDDQREQRRRAESPQSEAPSADAAQHDDAPGNSAGDESDSASIELEPEQADAESAIDVLSKAVEVAGLPRTAMVSVILACAKISAGKSRTDLMLESLLVSAVAQFEVFVSRLITASLRFDPSVLDRSEKSYTFKDLARFKTMEEFTATAVDAYVDSLMYEGMDSWMSFLSRATRTETGWVSDHLAEVVMRRNVHVHAGGRASSQYVNALGNKGAAVRVGDPLPVTTDYLADALDRMAQSAIVLSQAAAYALCQKLNSSKEAVNLDPDIGVVESSFDLLAAGRYRAVGPLAEHLGPLVATASSRERLRVNSLLARKKLDGLDSIRRELDEWDVSAAEDELRLAKLCLSEDVDAAARLYKSLEEAGRISVMELAMWPILEPIRHRISGE